MDERSTLELPAEPAYIAAARLFAAAVARQYGVQEDAVEDIKLAISEACGSHVGGQRDGTLRVTVERAGDRLALAVSGPARPVRSADDTPTPTPEELASALGLDVIKALFEDAVLSDGPGDGSTLRFSVPSAA
jgi:serine/threonine-protein kinase RsbW